MGKVSFFNYSFLSLNRIDADIDLYPTFYFIFEGKQKGFEEITSTTTMILEHLRWHPIHFFIPFSGIPLYLLKHCVLLYSIIGIHYISHPYQFRNLL